MDEHDGEGEISPAADKLPLSDDDVTILQASSSRLVSTSFSDLVSSALRVIVPSSQYPRSIGWTMDG